MNKSTLTTVGVVAISLMTAFGVHRGVQALMLRRAQKLREENMEYYEVKLENQQEE